MSDDTAGGAEPRSVSVPAPCTSEDKSILPCMQACVLSQQTLTAFRIHNNLWVVSYLDWPRKAGHGCLTLPRQDPTQDIDRIRKKPT